MEICTSERPEFRKVAEFVNEGFLPDDISSFFVYPPYNPSSGESIRYYHRKKEAYYAIAYNMYIHADMYVKNDRKTRRKYSH